MPKNRKEAKNCHDCGLEAIDECESGKGHIPADETLLPCVYCVRNLTERETPMRFDFWDEQWTRLADRTPIIENPDPVEQNLLRTLHNFVNGGKINARKS